MNYKLKTTNVRLPTENPKYMLSDILSDIADKELGFSTARNSIIYEVQDQEYEDPLQAHLRVMEAKKPSSQIPEIGLIKLITNRTKLVTRALLYKGGFKDIRRKPEMGNSLYHIELEDMFRYDENGKETLADLEEWLEKCANI